MLGLAAGMKSPLICTIAPGEGTLHPILSDVAAGMHNTGTCSKVVSMTLCIAVLMSTSGSKLYICQTSFFQMKLEFPPPSIIDSLTFFLPWDFNSETCYGYKHLTPLIEQSAWCTLFSDLFHIIIHIWDARRPNIFLHSCFSCLPYAGLILQPEYIIILFISHRPHT